MRRMLSLRGAGALVLAVLPSSAAALTIQLTASLDGAQEVNGSGVPNQGDPDGTGTAVLMIDDQALTVSWDFTALNIDFPLLGAHIHQAPAGVNGSIVVDFSAQLSGSGLQDPDLANVLANPSGFYVNFHNGSFPNGAIRGQLPEPGGLALLGVGLAALAALRRRSPN